MPMPGDQHRDTAATTNPFLEQKPHLSEFTAQEIATLQSRLDKQLGPEYISTRPGAGGGKVHYLAAEKVINLANEVFGFNGWSSAIQNVQIDFVDENRENGKITLGLSTIVRVTLRDGTYHEDIGYGHIENCKGKAAAFEKAKKEAATDAMKRALRNFGNVLGNCLYDKDYLQKVTKVKVAPSKWDADNLHRHPDYAPIKREAIAEAGPQQLENKGSAPSRQISVQSGASFGSMEFEDDFGANPFDEADITHPDEVRTEDSRASVNTPAKAAYIHQQQQRQGVPRTHSMPQIRPPNIQPPPAMQAPQAPQRPPGPSKTPNQLSHPPATKPLPHQIGNHQQRSGLVAAQNHTNAPGPRSNPSSATAGDSSSNHVDQNRQLDGAVSNHPDSEMLDEASLPPPQQPPPGIPEGFVTGRSAAILNQPAGARPPNSALAFNPHAETPSIRRTHGINPGKSAPVTRSAINGASIANGPQTGIHAQGPAGPQQQQVHQVHNNGSIAVAPNRPNFVDPSADMSRRIGMPPSAAAHTMHNRTAYKPPTPAKRPPLSDVSNIQQVDGAGDSKKAKIDHTVDSVADAHDGSVAAASPA